LIKNDGHFIHVGKERVERAPVPLESNVSWWFGQEIRGSIPFGIIPGNRSRDVLGLWMKAGSYPYLGK
jgi:hypothetical protein